MTDVRDTELPGQVLLSERDALLRLLGERPPEDFDRPTVCTGWSVRDVLAHCGAVLTALVEQRPSGFTAEDNEADVALRRGWPVEGVLRELEVGATAAAPLLVAAGGRLDGVALGVWVHGGDVRDALGDPSAYAGEAAESALTLLVERTRARSTPPVRARVSGREVLFGTPVDGRAEASLTADLPTVFRLYAGRRPDPVHYRLVGAAPEDLTVFA